MMNRKENHCYPPNNHSLTENGASPTATLHLRVTSMSPQTTEDGEKASEETKKPLALCTFFVKQHNLAFGLTLGLHIAMLILTGILIGIGVDVIVLNFESVPLELMDHPTYLRAQAWANKNEDGSVLGKDTAASTIGERSRTADILMLIYRAEGTVFTGQRLQEIQKIEDRLFNVPEYQNFCQLLQGTGGGKGQCAKPKSILRFFDGSYGSNYNDSSFANVPGTLYRAMQVPQLNQALQLHLAVDSEISSTEAKSTVTRTFFFLGWPLKGFDLKAGNLTEQNKKIRAFEVNHFLNILKDVMRNGAGDMEFLYISGHLFSEALISQAFKDMLLAVGSFFFIFLFMLFMTKSLFITSFGIFSILSSYSITMLIYRFIFQYRYFGLFHILSIFIILGIGVDDVFVFTDTWRAAGHSQFPSLEHRLSACYRQAASATLCTSLTTMVAFFSNALSPLLAIESFGLFSGILVFVNYLSVIVFFPTVIVVYHKHWESWTWPCFICCKKCRKQVTPLRTKRHHPIVRFFRGPFYSLLTHKIIRFVLLGVCLGLILLFTVYAFRIEPDEREIKFYRESHQVSRIQKLQDYGFKPNSRESVIEVYIVWGLQHQDLGTCDNSGIWCKGTTRWDTSFDLNPKRAQSALMEFCNRLHNLTQAEVDKLKIRRNRKTGHLQIQCFMDRINAYMLMESRKPQYPNDTDLTLPYTERKVETLITSNRAIYNVTSVSPNHYRYFETVMGFWLHDGYSGHAGYDYEVYAPLLGEGRDSFDTKPVPSNPEYSWATKLLYAAVVVNTTLKAGTFSYKTGLAISSDWENFIQKQSDEVHSTLSGMFQCTPNQGNPWHLFNVQKELVDTVFQGIFVGLALAFVVITLATKNIITGLLATLNIGIVTLSVVGLIPMAGWKSGVLESLNLSLVVGLAVDYVVHLAEGYHSSTAEDRLTRTRDMLEHVGISILSGAVTTLGAAVFMIAAVIVFFMQFGIFIFATIGFSLFYSLFGFSVLMGLIGPQGQTGSLVPVVWWVCYRLRGKRSHHVQCQRCNGKGFHIEKDMSPETRKI